MKSPITLVLAGLLTSSSLAAAQDTLPPELERLRTPQLTERPSESMLVVEARGDPGIVGGAAFGLLFQLYYQIPETPKGPGQAPPRARWPVGFTQPREEWIGLYALPIPATVRVLPQPAGQPRQLGLTATIATWDYGMVVEVLHVGPYDQEAPTLARLREFAESKGYVLGTEHEEEYIRGPTETGPGDPARYLTVLRYRVTRKPTG